MKKFKANLRFLVVLFLVLSYCITSWFGSLFHKDPEPSYRDGMVKRGKKILRYMKTPLKINGLENLDSTKTYMFMSNHQSYTDILVILLSLGIAKRRVAFMSKKEIFHIPFLSKAMRVLQCVAIDRGNTAKTMKSFNACIAALKKGVDMTIFPEGTRSVNRELLPFKKGAFLMARKAEVDILPIAIRGTDKLMPKKGVGMYQSDLSVSYLKAISIKDKSEAELMAELETVLKTELADYKL